MKSEIVPFHPYNPDLARKFEEASRRKSTVQDFVDEFLGQLLSEETKRGYVKDLQLFFDFLRSGNVHISHPSQIQRIHFQLYRDDMMGRGLASATINRRLVAIRSFIKWAMASKLTDHNPLEAIKLPKVQTESPTVAFDDKEVVRMIAAPDLSSHRGRTHRLIIILLFTLGLRRAELVKIRMKDFIQERGHQVLRIRGKGDKVRLMPLTDFVLGEISTYLNHLKRERIELGEDDFLLQSELGASRIPVDGSTVYRVINRYAAKLKINKRVSPHSCRATVISHLLDTQELPIRDVATFAGHANITTTERYDKRRNNLNKSAAYSVNYGKIKTS